MDACIDYEDDQMVLPLDERFRQAEQYALDFTSVPHQRTEPSLIEGSCIDYEDDQMVLPLDERFRQAEQYALDFTSVPHQRTEPSLIEGSCPYHRTFQYECRICNPR